jgi:hypothetical protein
LVGEEFDNYGLQYLTVPAGSPPGVLSAAGTVFGDAINLHIYPMYQGHAQTIDSAGDSLSGSLAGDFVSTYAHGFAGYTLAHATAKTRAITEFGYAAVGGSPGSVNVDVPTQGKCILNAIMNAWNEGYIALSVVRVFGTGSGLK